MTAYLLISIMTIANNTTTTDTYKSQPMPFKTCNETRLDMIKTLDNLNEHDILGYSVECSVG